MRRQIPWVLAIAIVLALPGASYAQEATVTGTITDSTGGVLPGVTVTATNTDSGNTFVAVTDSAGVFRLPLRIGTYQFTAELSGFATVTRSGIEMQINQRAVLNLQLAPSTVQETVQVTGEAPLLDLTSSTVSGNIDQRQVQDLPVNGRNWLDLTLLAPGSRANAGGESPIPRAQVAFQINMDGQQVTNSVTSTTEPRYSRDSIAEFEFVVQPVRRHAGPLDGRGRQRRHQVGHEPAERDVLRLLPRRAAQHQGLRAEPRAAVFEPAGQRDLRRADQEGPDSLLRELGRTSASRRPTSMPARGTRNSTWICRASAGSARAASRWTFN